MAYISVLVPAFYTKEIDENEIIKMCSTQFEKSSDEFELIKIDKSEFVLKFNQSDLSLNKIEDLIYQRDCIKSLVEKTFESLQTIMDKLLHMEKDLHVDNVNIAVPGKTEENTPDAQKLKNLLNIQLENSENFRLNTERTLNRIKEEFQQMVLELDILRKQTSKHKPVKSMDFHVDKINVNKKNQEVMKKVPKLKLNK